MRYQKKNYSYFITKDLFFKRIIIYVTFLCVLIITTGCAIKCKIPEGYENFTVNGTWIWHQGDAWYLLYNNDLKKFEMVRCDEKGKFFKKILDEVRLETADEGGEITLVIVEDGVEKKIEGRIFNLKRESWCTGMVFITTREYQRFINDEKFGKIKNSEIHKKHREFFQQMFLLELQCCQGTKSGNCRDLWKSIDYEVDWMEKDRDNILCEYAQNQLNDEQVRQILDRYIESIGEWKKKIKNLTLKQKMILLYEGYVDGRSALNEVKSCRDEGKNCDTKINQELKRKNCFVIEKISDDDDDVKPFKKAPDKCTINNQTYSHGQTASFNHCLKCNIKNPYNWSYNNGVPCKDKDYCNGKDFCYNGSCSGHSGSPCKKGYKCVESTDSCVEKKPPVCVINGTTIPKGSRNANNLCQICDPSINPTGWTAASDGSSCDDHKFCTVEDSCHNGECSGEDRSCGYCKLCDEKNKRCILKDSCH